MALKVFDLQCEQGHVFEGWFGSHEDYDAQQARDLAARMARLQAAVLRQVRELVRNTENVGARFAQEARRIHEGEADERPIRGTATPQERAELADDGIDVVSLPAFLDDERMQ